MATKDVEFFYKYFESRPGFRVGFDEVYATYWKYYQGEDHPKTIGYLIPELIMTFGLKYEGSEFLNICKK